MSLIRPDTVQPSTLIIVCCHATYLGSPGSNIAAGTDEERDWLLEPFQRGETPTFIEHACTGVVTLRKCLDRGEDALLVFSGGPTKSSQGCLKSEGQSYLVGAIESSCAHSIDAVPEFVHSP